MSMPLSNVLQSQTITDSHLSHHSKVDSELVRRRERRHMDTGSIYLPPLARDNNHNYGGRNIVEIRRLDINEESQPLSRVIETCRGFNGITTTGRMFYRDLKIASALDGAYGGTCKKTHAATELAEGLRLNLFMRSPFGPVEDYTIHEITLGPGYNAPGYAGITIEYISTLPTSQIERWTDERPRIGIYIDQIMIVSGAVNFSELTLAALLSVNIELGNDPIIGIEVYPGTAGIYAKTGYKVIPGDENASFKRMTL